MAAPMMHFGTEELKPTMMLPITHGTGDKTPPPKTMTPPMMHFESLKPTMALPITTTGGDTTPPQFDGGAGSTQLSTNGNHQMMTTITSPGSSAHQLNPQLMVAGSPAGSSIQGPVPSFHVPIQDMIPANGGGYSGGKMPFSGGAGSSGGMPSSGEAGSSGGGLPANFKGKLPEGFNHANIKGQLPPGFSLEQLPPGFSLQQNGANGVTTVTTTTMIPKCKDLNGVEIQCPEGYQNGPPTQQGSTTTWNSIKAQYPSGGHITTEIKAPPPGWIPPPMDNSGPPPQVFPMPFPSNEGTSIPTPRPRPRPGGQLGKLCYDQFTVRFTILSF